MRKDTSTLKATRRARRPVKQRKTFTLSAESIALLEELTGRGNPHALESVSAVLDGLLLGIRKEKARQELERKVGEYYDERSREEEEEEIAWGKFALSQFPVDDSGPKESR
jgi:hypothetical protein